MISSTTGMGDGIDDGGAPRSNIVISSSAKGLGVGNPTAAGVIRGFNVGINFPACYANYNATINAMTVVQSKSTGISVNIPNSSFTGVASENNGGAGIKFGGSGSFDDVTVTGNKGDGITALNTNDNVFTNIVANSNGGVGLNLGPEGNNNVISSSTVNGNSSDGVDFGANNVVMGTTVANNNGVGIHGFDCCNAVTASQVSNNTQSHGIELDGFNQLVSNSVANKNGGDGVLITGGQSVVSGVTANGNTSIGFDLSGNTFNNLVKCGEQQPGRRQRPLPQQCR
jgi:hypothetical protein